MSSKYEILSLVQANSSSDLSQVLILQFLLPSAFLPPLPSLLNFTLAKHLFNSILIKLFIRFLFLPYLIRPHPTTGTGYTKPYAIWSQSNLLSSYIQIIIPYRSNTLPIKKLSPYSHFSFKVRQHGQQKLYIQYKACNIFTKW